MISPELRAQIDARNLEHETEFHFMVGENDLVAIASGYVPNTVKALAYGLLHWHDEELRKMEDREAHRTRKTRIRTPKAKRAKQAPTPIPAGETT